MEDLESESFCTAPPEHKLLMNILTRAILDAIQGTASISPETQREAINWIKDNRHHPFSFLWICSQLNKPNKDIRLKLSALYPELF